MTVFELVAKLTLDSSEYESDLKKQSENGGKLAGAWGKVGKAVKVGAVAIGAASAAVGALTKKSIDAYAEFEQLKGGVEKLYGSAADELMGYANEAYKTSGMSANKYMEQATSFSAALINSLDGDVSKAAKQTDVAMRAISDNYNTFGGDINNVTNAFQGFAKGQFNMLDNLRLGYGGTKSEMERLIADANEYAEANGKAADLTIDSFSDIVTAIELVQEKQGIAGTTSKEAATTLEGSLNMTKAAWENLVTSFADPDADIGQAMDNLITAIVGDKDGEGLLNNIIPAIERAVEGIGKFIEAAVPALAEKLPSLIQTFLPVIVNSIVTLITSLIQALPDILTALVDMLPDLVQTALTALIDAIVTVTPQLLSAIWQMLKTAVTAFTKIDWIGLGIKAFNKVKDGIEKIKPVIERVVHTLVSKILDYLGFTGLREKVASAFESAKAAITEKLEAAKSIVSGWIQTIKGMFPFNIGKLFSGSVSLPSIKVNKNGNKASTSMATRQENFAKAMNQPYMFTRPTIFDQKVAGEAGDEILYGRNALMNDIEEATSKSRGGVINNFYINNYVDGAESPEQYADRFLGAIQMKLRAQGA